MSGAELLRLAVTRGRVGSELPSAIKVKHVVGDTAYVNLVKAGNEIPGEMPMMRRVGTQWLVDLVAMKFTTRVALLTVFSALAQLKGTDVDGAMLFTIGQLTGTPPPDDIWDPPR